ncbi:DUF935 domain-containing protein [Desulfopila inferna]|uniref:DUF935 domain-containing protein n=1 Tax=Desulfopila inferna TaxID=468528 RepID=UPI001964B89C|nr:DUF935 domain-containing protein [Desulfopila inferna]MBM9605958.1 DUF935 domain-containing protein [Desulfopila inferna]
MVKLYDQFNREIDISKNKKPERAALAVAPILDSFREYVTYGLTPERLAAVFKAADAGDLRAQAELFDQLEERDGHLLCERDKRKNVILDVDFTIEPASDDGRDAKVAEFVEQSLQDIADYGECLISLQDAVGKGFACLENHWDASEGQAVIQQMEFVEQKRFRFNDDAGLLRKYPRLVTDTDAMGVEIPAWKATMHQYGGKSGHPARSGIYRVASWMVLFKNYAIKDWVIFCELFGMPLRIGKYDQGAGKEDKDALINAISSLGSDAAGIISKSTEIEFVETVKSARGDLWKLLADFCNAEISKAVLGQTLSAQVGDKGSYAASKTHNEVRLDLLTADGRALASTIRSQVIRPLVGFNFGWDTPLPKYLSKFDEGENLKEKAEWIGELMDRSVPMSLPWLRKEFSIPEPEKGEEIITASKSLESPYSAKIVAADKPAPDRRQQVLDNHAEELAGAADLSGNEAAILEAVQRANSYEEAFENVLALYPDMDVATLQDSVETAMVNGNLFGRMAVSNGD